jgi:hypothetical protein
MKKLHLVQVNDVIGGKCTTSNQFQQKAVYGSSTKIWVCVPTTVCSDKHGSSTSWDPYKSVPNDYCL